MASVKDLSSVMQEHVLNTTKQRDIALHEAKQENYSLCKHMDAQG